MKECPKKEWWRPNVFLGGRPGYMGDGPDGYFICARYPERPPCVGEENCIPWLTDRAEAAEARVKDWEADADRLAEALYTAKDALTKAAKLLRDMSGDNALPAFMSGLVERMAESEWPALTAHEVLKAKGGAEDKAAQK